jgi:hypothetical protein
MKNKFSNKKPKSIQLFYDNGITFEGSVNDKRLPREGIIKWRVEPYAYEI